VSEASGKNALPTVLVVDDDEFSREVTRTILAPLRLAPLIEAGNGRAGVRALERLTRAPDFIICNIFMPDMDGIEFIGELAKRHYHGGLVLVTREDAEMLAVARQIAQSRKLNVVGSFIKPLHKQALALALGLESVG
jgi:CheY-like chemotaxis protein